MGMFDTIAIKENEVVHFYTHEGYRGKGLVIYYNDYRDSYIIYVQNTLVEFVQDLDRLFILGKNVHCKDWDSKIANTSLENMKTLCPLDYITPEERKRMYEEAEWERLSCDEVEVEY